MNRFATSRAVLGALVALSGFSAAPAYAALNSFVSVAGTDSGNCDIPTSPCRTFQYALGKTTVNGEIKALTPGNYFSVTVNKSIRLSGVPGAGISRVNPGDAIVINGAPGDVVQIDGLTLDGVNTSATNGIVFNSGSRLSVTNTIVRNFNNYGINLATNAGSSQVSIEDVHIEQTNNVAIRVGAPVAGPTINALLNRVTIVNISSFGVDIQQNATVSITNSVVSLTTSDGIHLGTATSNLFLSKSQSVRTFGHGVHVDAGAAQSGGDNFLGGNSLGPTFGTLTNIGNL